MKMDDMKKILCEESTKASNYLPSADWMQMQYDNEKHKAAQYENELILLKYNLDPNLQTAVTSISVCFQQPSLYMASTFASSITTLGMSSANTTHALTFVFSIYGLPVSTMAAQTGQHVFLTPSSTTAISRTISVLSIGMPITNVTSVTSTSSAPTASTILQAHT